MPEYLEDGYSADSVEEKRGYLRPCNEQREEMNNGELIRD